MKTLGRRKNTGNKKQINKKDVDKKRKRKNDKIH